MAVLAMVHVPLGDYLARVYASGRRWRVETALYRVCGVDPESDQRWTHYLASLLAFSAVGVLMLYALLRLQAYLPISVIFAMVLIGLGVAQNLAGPHVVATLSGGRQAMLGRPVGSWEPIKLLSGDGGGFFNANSAHPLENPTQP